MANISSKLNQTFKAPNIAATYGPYESVAAAHAALADDRLNVVGMTVGIISGSTITEYWYQGGTAQSNLVAKQSGGGGGDVTTEQMNAAIDASTHISASIVNDDGTAMTDYDAGTIFYTEDSNGVKTYHIAKQDGSEGDDVTATGALSNFIHTASSIEAVNYSLNIINRIVANEEVDSQKGTASGIASLDNEAKIPVGQIPTTIKTGAEKAVRFESQELTDAQKVQALNNIEGKSYDAASFSGFGKKILAKNIQEIGGVSKNVLTQAMINTANTVYVIKYDYDLNGAEITVPSGCTLEFDGGSFGNGTLVGTDTIVVYNGDKIQYFRDTILNGTFIDDNEKGIVKSNKLSEIVPDIIVSSQEKFENLVSDINNNAKSNVIVLLKEGVYTVPSAVPSAITKSNVTIYGENATIIGHHKKLRPYKTDNKYSYFNIKEVTDEIDTFDVDSVITCNAFLMDDNNKYLPYNFISFYPELIDDAGGYGVVRVSAGHAKMKIPDSMPDLKNKPASYFKYSYIRISSRWNDAKGFNLYSNDVEDGGEYLHFEYNGSNYSVGKADYDEFKDYWEAATVTHSTVPPSPYNNMSWEEYYQTEDYATRYADWQGSLLGRFRISFGNYEKNPPLVRLYNTILNEGVTLTEDTNKMVARVPNTIKELKAFNSMGLLTFDCTGQGSASVTIKGVRFIGVSPCGNGADTAGLGAVNAVSSNTDSANLDVFHLTLDKCSGDAILGLYIRYAGCRVGNTTIRNCHLKSQYSVITAVSKEEYLFDCENNVFEGSADSFKTYSLVGWYSGRIKVENNVIKNIPYSGLNHSVSNSTLYYITGTIAHNEIYDDDEFLASNPFLGVDGGGIYVCNRDSDRKLIVEDNVVHNLPNLVGIYLDYGCSNVDVLSNLVYDCGSLGINVNGETNRPNPQYDQNVDLKINYNIVNNQCRIHSASDNAASAGNEFKDNEYFGDLKLEDAWSDLERYDFNFDVVDGNIKIKGTVFGELPVVRDEMREYHGSFVSSKLGNKTVQGSFGGIQDYEVVLVNKGIGEFTHNQNESLQDCIGLTVIDTGVFYVKVFSNYFKITVVSPSNGVPYMRVDTIYFGGYPSNTIAASFMSVEDGLFFYYNGRVYLRLVASRDIKMTGNSIMVMSPFKVPFNGIVFSNIPTADIVYPTFDKEYNESNLTGVESIGRGVFNNGKHGLSLVRMTTGEVYVKISDNYYKVTIHGGHILVDVIYDSGNLNATIWPSINELFYYADGILYTHVLKDVSLNDNSVVVTTKGEIYLTILDESTISDKVYAAPLQKIGSNRPLLGVADGGYVFFDTTIGKPIWWNGTAWVDALGNDVSTVYPKVIGTPTAGNLVKFNSTNATDIEDAGVAPNS